MQRKRNWCVCVCAVYDGTNQKSAVSMKGKNNPRSENVGGNMVTGLDRTYRYNFKSTLHCFRHFHFIWELMELKDMSLSRPWLKVLPPQWGCCTWIRVHWAPLGVPTHLTTDTNVFLITSARAINHSIGPEEYLGETPAVPEIDIN